MRLQKLIVFIIATMFLCSCGIIATPGPSTPTMTHTVTQTSSPYPTSTSTPTPTSTTTPTPTETPTPTSTFTPTPTPTLIGGFTGSFLTVEGSQDQREIILWNAAGERIRTLWNSPTGLTAGGYVDVSWSPNGTMIAVEYWQDGGYLVLLSLDGSEIKTVETGINFYGGPNGQANWSPDGKWLVFVGKGENDYIDVYRINADGDNLLQLTNTYTEYNSPIFHPDGSRIIYRDEQDSLWIMGVDGSDRRLLISGPAAILDWSPNAKTVLIAKASPVDIFIMDFETLALTRYTFDGMEIVESRERFSADGQWILYGGYGWPSTGNREPKTGMNLFIMPVNMSQEPLYLATVYRAIFSPDGNLIFFHGWSKGEDVTVDDPSYYSIRLDGSDLTKLDENGYGLVYGIWSP